MKTLPPSFQQRNGAELKVSFNLNGIVYTQNNIIEISDIVREEPNYTQVSLVCTQDVLLPKHKDKCSIFLSIRGGQLKIFEGQVNSPIIKDDVDKTIKFSVLSVIETLEVSFSAEESQLDFVPKSLESVVWPLAFGHTIYQPATLVSQEPTATLRDPLCIVDPMLQGKINEAIALIDQAAFFERFWERTMEIAKDNISSVTLIIESYVNSINTEDALAGGISEAELEISVLEDKKETNPNDQAVIDDLNFWRPRLKTLAEAADLTLEFRDQLNQEIEKLFYNISVFDDASSQAVRAHNDRRAAMLHLQSLEKIKCLQERCVVSQVAVQDYEEFQQATPLDVVINDVQFNVTFNDDVMTINGVNTSFYDNVLVSAWVPDDEPCSQYDIFNGIDVFYLSDSSVNLQGKWLRVKRLDSEQRHIIKCVEQKGNKVYFELVQWNFNGGGGYPRKPSLDNAADALLQPPIPSAWPNFPSVPSGDYDPANFNQSERERLTQIVSALNEPPNAEELQTLAKLVIAERYTGLGYNGLFNSTMLTGFGFTGFNARQIFTIIGPDIESVEEVRGLISEDWLDGNHIYEEIPQAQEWVANPQTEVYENKECGQIFVTNILPSTIEGVYAYYKDEEGRRELRPVPSNWYTKLEDHNLGSIDITAVVLKRRLFDPWEPQIYVTQTSSVGPNTSDIVKHIVETYTDLNVDTTSFDAVKTKLTNYPMDFFITERSDALEFARNIAYFARCALSIENGQVKIKYMSEEPTTDLVLDSSMIKKSTLIKGQEQTEDLYSVFKSRWSENSIEKEREYTLRHNTKTLGRIVKDSNYFVYTHRELVEKSTTFEAIRNSNSFQIWSLECDLRAVGLEIFDTVEIEGIKCIVIRTVFSYEKNNVQVQVLTPLIENQTTAYQFFWPSSLGSGTVWPPSTDTNTGIGRLVEGTIPCQ